MLVIPEAFARGTVAREGERGAAWLSTLPGLISELLDRWRCVPDGDVTHGGVGIIVPARQEPGRAAVLKVSFPHPGNVHEPDAFVAWGGRGAVLLHERDDGRIAMLLERAQTSTLAATGDRDEVAAVSGQLDRQLAIPAPPGLPRLSDQAGAWETQLRADAAELHHTMPGYVIDAAVATVRELGHAQPAAIVHGDLHAKNILRASRLPWLAVDPKGYAGDPAYDGGTLVTSHLRTLLSDAAGYQETVHRMIGVFAEAAQLDRERVQRWAQLRVVQAVCWNRRPGLVTGGSGSPGRRLAEFADQVAEFLTEPRPGR